MRASTTYPYSKLIHAKRLARQHNRPYMVYLVDHEDGRAVRIADYDYAREPEFLAFDGEVLAIIYPDGEVEV